MGDPDQLHSYSYTPDVAAALITLGTAARRHRPDLAPASRRDPDHPADRRRTSTGSPGVDRACSPPGRPTLRLFGLIEPAIREYLHTLYQFTDRWVVDDTGTGRRSATSATPWTTPWPPPSSGTPRRTTPRRRPPDEHHDHSKILGEHTDVILAFYRAPDRRHRPAPGPAISAAMLGETVGYASAARIR